MNDPGILAAVKALIPKVPLISRTALFHTIGYSETSKHWDLRTEVLVNVLRSFLAGPSLPLGQMQRLSMKAPEVKGRIWVSKVTLPAPSEDVIREVLFKVIEGFNEDGVGGRGFTKPDLKEVEAEWTGYRKDATPSTPEMKISEKEKYEMMMKEVESPATVLYFHGGAMYLMDPATHRDTCKKLAKISKGRCLNVRYRLAPQAPFPAALLDSLLAYLSLLYPPEGSWHTAVSPEHIVFAGDSAGGMLSFALLQLVLEVRRQNLMITFHGVEREVPLPGGVATCSPWLDVTHSTPSCESNAKYDYLPARSVNPSGPTYPTDELWPTTPQRSALYAEDSFLSHPLVSPITAKDWSGSPPLYIGTGEELLTDEDKYVASLAAQQGVTVVFEEYLAMPHVFSAMLGHLPASKRFFDGWGGFIRDVVEKKGVETRGIVIEARTLKEREVDVRKVCEFGRQEVMNWVEERVEKMSAKRPDPLAKL